MKALLLIFSTCLLVVPAQAQYGGGSGTVEDPYQIAKAEDLMLLGESPEDYDKHFILTADIDLAGHVFDKAVIAPDANTLESGFQGTSFTGVFEGNGHTISHLTINGASYLGLFGQLDGAEIRDVGVVDVNVTGSGGYVGSLGGSNYGSISTSYSTGTIHGEGLGVGGLVGNNFGAVDSCFSSAHVNGGAAVGGLMGANYGVMTFSCSTGEVRGVRPQCSQFGGLAGFNKGSVSDCYSTGAVSGPTQVGGLVGDNRSSISRCYSTGEVSATYGGGRVGGLVGGLTYNWRAGYGSVTDSFWDIETSGASNMCGFSDPSGPACDESFGKMTEQMQSASTFLQAGWDFVGESDNGTEDIWWILEGRSYPRLWWQCGRAFSAHPPDGAIDVTQPLILSWIAGGSNLHHDVYFGDDEQAVVNATIETAGIYRGRQAADVTTYDPGMLELDKTYYWRIDEVNEADANSPWKGRVWSFTTADFIVVDDFEAYDDYCNRIFYTWVDGWGHSGDPDCGVAPCPGNDTGATVSYLIPIPGEHPLMPPHVVHAGNQSMPFAYDNTMAPFYSEAQREWTVPQDWTREGVKALTLWFHGDSDNVVEKMYVAVANANGPSAVVCHNKPDAVLIDTWTEWNIPLTEFSSQGVVLTDVDTLSIGFGQRDNPQAGGLGAVWFDDIRLYRPRCVASLLKPEADLSGNCVVDLADIEILASQWLQSGAGLAADLDADGDVDLGDFGQIADAWLEELLWPQP